MEQKAKFIIIGLAVFTLACLFLFIQTFNAKQDLTRERNDLKTENSTLNTKIDKLTVSLRGYESKITSLTKDLEDAVKQRLDLEKKLDEVDKAKEELNKKLKLQASQMETLSQSPVQQEQPSQTDDTYWAEVLKSKNEMELQLSNLRNDFKSIQIINEQAQREKNSLELDLKGLKRENADLKRQIEYNQKLAEGIAQDLVREKNDKKQIQDGYKTVKNENILLRRQLQSLNSRKVNLEKKLQGLQEGKVDLEQKLSQMETMFTDGAAQMGGLKQKVDNIKSGLAKPVLPENKSKEKDSVDLPAIVVKPQGEALGSAGDSRQVGKILAVNRENNFVIINSGFDAGLKTKDVLKVYRGERVIAVIEAIQIRKDISACDIKREIDSIKIGDTVK